MTSPSNPISYPDLWRVSEQMNSESATPLQTVEFMHLARKALPLLLAEVTRLGEENRRLAARLEMALVTLEAALDTKEPKE